MWCATAVTMATYTFVPGGIDYVGSSVLSALLSGARFAALVFNVSHCVLMLLCLLGVTRSVSNTIFSVAFWLAADTRNAGSVLQRVSHSDSARFVVAAAHGAC